MIDIIVAGLCTALLVFMTLFIISFVALGMITGVKHMVAVVYRSLVIGNTPSYRKQTV